jgi:hypothetical protein
MNLKVEFPFLVKITLFCEGKMDKDLIAIPEFLPGTYF